MHIIAVVGPHQCGSTMFFNTFRLICEQHNHITDSCFLDNYITGNYNKDAKYLVIKCHERLPGVDFPPGTLTVLPNRHPLDSFISLFTRLRNTPEEIPDPDKDEITYVTRGKEYMLYNHKNFNDWKNQSIVVSYEEYMRSSIEEKVSTIVHVLASNGLHELASNAATIENAICEVARLHKSKDIISNDMFEDRNNALINPIYIKTLITQSHNTSDGKTQKYQSLPDSIQRAFAYDIDIVQILLNRGYRI